MDMDFDDIFGASTPIASSTIAAGDDEIDALFGIDTPDAEQEQAVRAAMAAERHVGNNNQNEETPTSVTESPSAAGQHRIDESFSDIFGESPTNVSSDVVSMFASLNSDMDDLLTNLESTPKSSTTNTTTTTSSPTTRPERLFSLSDDEDDDVTDFTAPNFCVDSSTLVLDQGSPTPSPRNVDKKTTLSSFFGSSSKKKKKKTKEEKISLDQASSPVGTPQTETAIHTTQRDSNVQEKKNDDENKEQANITKETETLPILPPQEPVAAMTKTNARMIVARRTRRASSSAQGNHAIVLLTEEEVEQMLQRIESLASSKSIDNTIEEEVRTLCLQLVSSPTYYQSNHTLRKRGKVWSMLLGVSAHERDRTLENDMLSCDTLRNSAEMREDCHNAAIWATNTLNNKNGSSGGDEDDDAKKKKTSKNGENGENGENGAINNTNGVDVDALTTDMELLLTFWSAQKSNGGIGQSKQKNGVSYSSGSAWLAAPFYSSGLDHTTTIYKCMHAMESAIVPGMYRTFNNNNNNNKIATEEWRTMSIILFQLLLKYHDPTLTSHLGMDGSDVARGNGGSSSVASYLFPHSWLLGGFLLDKTLNTDKKGKKKKKKKIVQFVVDKIMGCYDN